MGAGIRAGGIMAVSGVAVLLAACGSASSTTTPPTPATAASTSVTFSPTAAPAASNAVAGGNFNSCSVVTATQAASALGQPVSAGVLGHATVEGGLACVFYGPSAPSPHDPNVAQPDTVRVVVVKGPNALKWYNDYKSKVNAQPVSGYGDQAYYDGYASLSVLKGASYLRIAVAPAGAPPSLLDEKKLATAILPSL